MTIRTDIRLLPRFTDHLMVPDLSTVLNKLLLLQMITIEVSLYCCDK